MTIKTGAALQAQIESISVPDGMLALWSLGQSGVVLKGGDTIAVIDPYLSDSVAQSGGPQRRFAPPIAPALLDMADIVFCTHEHIDHTDLATLEPLLEAAADAPVIVSKQGAGMLAELTIDPGRVVVPQLGVTHRRKGLHWTAVPAAHETVEIDSQGYSRWMGFVIELNGVTVLHAGDTIPCDELHESLAGRRIDIALLPINGRDYYRNQQDLLGNFLPREATEFAHRIGAEVLMPNHNDLFDANRLNPAYLWDDLDRRFPRMRCHMLQPGELYLYVS
jgi:L-ascorbate 6-phosphate lactonase